MNRIDELTDRLIESTLTEAEAEELVALTSTDPDALERHLSLLNLEANLRGLRTELDLGTQVIQEIESTRAERVAENVVNEISDLPAPGWRRNPPTRKLNRRSKSRWLVAVGVAFSLALGVWFALRPPTTDTPATAPEVAHLRAITGTVEVSDPDGTNLSPPTQAVSSGQIVRTVGDDSAVIIEFPDKTRLELNSETEVRVASLGDRQNPRLVHLVRGHLSVVVSGRQTVVRNGSAEVCTVNGSYSVWASSLDSLRVEAKNGDVQVIRHHPADTISLNPGRAAFVRDQTTPTQLETAFEVHASPRATLDVIGALDVAFTDDGKTIWAATAKQRVGWRPLNGTTERILFTPRFKNDGHFAALTADGLSLLTCGLDDKEDRIIVRDITTGASRHTIPVRVSEPRFCCAAPDASWVATLSAKPERRLRLWDSTTGQERLSRELDVSANCMASTVDGRYVAIGVTNLRRSTDNRLDFLDVKTGELPFSLPTARRSVTAIAFTPNGKFLAAGSNGAVQIWDMETKHLARTLEGFERGINRLAFSPDGRLVAGGTQDGQVWVWSTDTGQRLKVFDTGTRGVRALAFSPDGKSLVTATNKAPVALWDVKENRDFE